MARITKAEKLRRVNQIRLILARGGTRSECLDLAATEWGLKPRSADFYIHGAKQPTNHRADAGGSQHAQIFGHFFGHLDQYFGQVNKKATLTDRSKPLVGAGFGEMEPRRLELLTPCVPRRCSTS